jgi:dephospho-CoA kinase
MNTLRSRYNLTVAEIVAEREAGRCAPDEAAERMVQAVVALYGRYLTPKGKEALQQHLRAEIRNDPELRKVFS